MIQEGPEAVRSLSSRSRSGPSETPTSRKRRNAGNTCADSASGKKVYHLQAPNFQQLLRDIDKGKVEELTLLPGITLVYSHETSTQPVLKSNHRMCSLSRLSLDETEKEFMVKVKMIQLPSTEFKETWDNAGSLNYFELSSAAQRSNIPSAVFATSLRFLSNKMTRAKSMLDEKKHMLAYLSYFEAQFAQKDVDAMRKNVRLRNQVYKDLVTFGICSPVTASNHQTEIHTAFCLFEKTKKEYFDALKNNFVWPSGQHFISKLFSASDANDTEEIKKEPVWDIDESTQWPPMKGDYLKGAVYNPKEANKENHQPLHVDFSNMKI
ncbi:hypothetical protein CRE_22128 [Caenorhabditis remanei]|uniref:Uncharacterized protein n=1 Tax=Caenorhabditis remanei TaxID=31234 RepID=E3NHK9_CAERE|nr:hypothetical protein CRE_22128 [Caenorhabditis remanei]